MLRRNTTGCLLKMKLDRSDLDTPSVMVNINSGESFPVDSVDLSFSTRERRPKSHDFSTELAADSTTTASTSDQHSPSDAGEFLCIPVVDPQERPRSASNDSEDDYISGSTGESGSSHSSSEESEGENTTQNREKRAYRKRRYIIREILATENTYVRHLRDMVEVGSPPFSFLVTAYTQNSIGAEESLNLLICMYV